MHKNAGRMALRGKMQMKGYFRLPEETKKAFADRWLLTNDMVYTDGEGYVYMLGRADEIINAGGKKVSPIEIENVAQEVGEIKECACIGVADPDGILGQVPVLYFAAEGRSIKKMLLQFLAGRMEKYKPLPRNQMQKISRKELKGLCGMCLGKKAI